MGLSFLPFEWLASLGYAGVDVFFVISGLVMAKTTENLKPGLASGTLFISKRFLRIFFGYWPVLIISCLLIWYFDAGYFDTKNAFKSVLLIGIKAEELLVPPSWSLAFELYFYLIIGFVLIFKIKQISHVFLILSLLIVIKINVIDFGVNELIDVFFSHMIFEFIMGYYLWKFRAFICQKKFIVLLLLISVLTLYLAVKYYLVATVWRPLVFGVFSVSILAMAMIKEGQINQIIVKLLKPIGDSSYTLYLLHFVMLFMFFSSGFRTWMTDNGFAVVAFLMLILLTVIISYVFYLFVEKPLYNSLRWKIITQQK